MRRFCLLLTLAILAACGSNPTTNNPPPTPYAVSATGTCTNNVAQDRSCAVTLKVTDKNTGDTVPNQAIILQVSVPNSTVTPNQPITGSNGRATVNWVILKADQVVGRTEAMAFCAPGPGQSFCKTSLSDPSSFTTTF